MGTPALTPIERAAGLIAGGAGPERRPPPLTPPLGGPGARAVLESVLAEVLERPCFVSFSGGRDSSAVLATAVAVARREGLPLPVPVSLRFPGVASTGETEWQELVVRHLAIDDWVRIEIDSELDFLGDIACGALRRHGLLWPPNASFHVPIFRVSRGGCVLTGFDGDGLFGWRWSRAASVLAGRVQPAPRDAVRVGLAVAPRSVRRLGLARRRLPPVTWLRPEAHRAFTRRWIVESATEPLRWDDRLTWYSGRRYLRLATRSLSLLAADHGVEVRHPLLDPRFLGALAREGGRRGWGERTESMAHLFGDLLPPTLIGRSRKAEFGRALWREQARAFAAAWDGMGVDTDLVDIDRLRIAWSADNPVFGSVTPLHAAWLASEVNRTRRAAPSHPRPDPAHPTDGRGVGRGR